MLEESSRFIAPHADWRTYQPRTSRANRLVRLCFAVARRIWRPAA